MRIDSYNKLQETGQVGVVGAQSKAGQRSQVEGPAGETVNFSTAAQELADRAASEADATKVANLQASIQNGTFKVDPQAIARRLVEGS
jgi:flagellar biosynthesis anti-sigma factor FlgM